MNRHSLLAAVFLAALAVPAFAAEKEAPPPPPVMMPAAPMATTSTSVTFSEQLPAGAKESAVADARAKLYKDATNECATLSKTMGMECRVSNMNVSEMAAGMAGPMPGADKDKNAGGKTITLQATYTLTAKGK